MYTWVCGFNVFLIYFVSFRAIIFLQLSRNELNNFFAFYYKRMRLIFSVIIRTHLIIAQTRHRLINKKYGTHSFKEKFEITKAFTTFSFPRIPTCMPQCFFRGHVLLSLPHCLLAPYQGALVMESGSQVVALSMFRYSQECWS